MLATTKEFFHPTIQANSINDLLSIKLRMHHYDLLKNGWLPFSFHCFVQKSFNFLQSKSESHAIIHLQTVRNETSACKIPIIDHMHLS